LSALGLFWTVFAYMASLFYSTERGNLIPLKSPVTVSEIQPAPYNPRKMDDDQQRTLKQSMETFGDCSGITVNVRTSHLVGGHQRVKQLEPSWKIKAPFLRQCGHGRRRLC